MERGSRPRSFRSALPLAALLFALVFTQSGCPGGADLENPDAWAGRFGETGGAAAGTGGTSPTGPVLDFSTIQCTGTTPQVVLNSKCATTGCHGNSFVVGLDLRPNEGFASRIKDKPATFGGIACQGSLTETCIPDSCPMGASLVDSDAPASSWMLQKLGMTDGCGATMPYTKTVNADEVACLTQIIDAVAALK